MSRKVLLLFTLLLSVISRTNSFSQTQIDHVHNSLRKGDALYSIESEYINPGISGTQVIWNIGEINTKANGYLEGINSNNDTITVFGTGHITHYLLKDNLLYLKAKQEPRSYRIFHKERPLICYPFSLGDSISGNFEGIGRYENFDLKIKGLGYSVADGTGILIAGKDTIFNVTRLHLYDDYCETFEENTTLHLQKHQYIWYGNGYRYPIMESTKTFLIDDVANITPIDSITHLYLPSLQDRIKDDAPNDSILYASRNGEGRTSDSESFAMELSNLMASMSSDGMGISVSYSLSAPSNVRIWASDVIGNTLCYINSKDMCVGEHSECMTFNQRPLGNIVVLNVICNNKNISLKVIKE